MSIHIATGIAIAQGRLLMVASRYRNHAAPLWTLPGGRQQPGELLTQTVEREFSEETGVCVRARELVYVSESYDGEQHYLNATFAVDILRQPERNVIPSAVEGQGASDDHVVAVEWVPLDEVAQRIVVAVVREPLLAFLAGTLPARYAGFAQAGVTIEWPDDSN